MTFESAEFASVRPPLLSLPLMPVQEGPKVSVIVPVYKAERYIAETLRSLLAQTYQNFEAIIIDDGSPDGSLEICQQFKDPRIRIIQQKNRGLAGARNTGIRQATGDYIAILDADDLWRPEKLEKHVMHLQSSPAIGLSFSCSAFIDGAGQPLGIYQMPRRYTNITPAFTLCRNPPGNGSTVVARREVFEAIAFRDNPQGERVDCYFNEHLRRAEDLECWTRIATHTSWKIEGIPEALTLYRVNGDGLSANVSMQYEAICCVIDQSCDSAPEKLGPYRNLAKAYYLRYSARRAVTLREGAMAVDFIHRAMAMDWRIFWEEPRRTGLTLLAAYILHCVPLNLYRQLEQLMLRITGNRQKSRMLRSV